MMEEDKDRTENIYIASFERFQHGTSFETFGSKYETPKRTWSRYYSLSVENTPQSQPRSERNIYISLQNVGKTQKPSIKEGKRIEYAIFHQATKLTRLQRVSFFQLAEFVLATNDYGEKGSKKLSRGWLDGFPRRRSHLKVVTIQNVDCCRTDALTEKHVCGNIPMVQVAMH